MTLIGCSSGGPDGGGSPGDTSAPVVMITSSVSTDNMPYPLRGTFTDNVAVTALSYSVDAGVSQAIQVIETPFSVELNLDEGEHQISVTASDAAGNAGSAEITLNFTPGASANAGTSTTMLIEEALAKGEITQETALLYGVYGLFGDIRLPTQYRGDDLAGLNDHALDEMMVRYDTLSPDTKAILDTFLVPPYYKGSWWDVRKTTTNNQKTSKAKVLAAVSPPCSPRDKCIQNSDQWVFKDTANGKVRVWFILGDAGAAATASTIVSEMDATIWPKLTTLMGGREPISDAGDSNNGGDGRLDISLVDFSDPDLSDEFNKEFKPSTFGFVINYPPGCEKDSVYMVVNIQRSMNEILATVTHELMHAIQWAYDVKEICLNGKENYKWLMEATATWAIDHVYPDNNTERPHAVNNFMPDPELSLDDLFENHEYGAYLFPFYLAQAFTPLYIRDIWEATTSADELDVLDIGIKAASGGATDLEEQWAKFTIRNWNRDPPIDDYKKWDGLTAGVKVIKGLADPETAELNGATEGLTDMPVRLPHLSSQYVYITFPDPDVRSVVFYNGFTYKVTAQSADFPQDSIAFVADELPADAKKGAQVWALIKVGDSWLEPEDWTNLPFKTFCRDSVKGRIQELVIIFSNADIEDREKFLEPQGLNPFLAFSNIGCWKWRGEVHFTDVNDGVTAQLDVTATWDAVSPMIFLASSGGTGLTGTNYRISEGNLDWQISGTNSSGCIFSGIQSVPLGEVTQSLNTYHNYNYVLDGDGYRGINILGFFKPNTLNPFEAAITATVTEICPGDPPIVKVNEETLTILTVAPKSPHGKVDLNGTTIEGDGTDAQGGTSVTGFWSFVAEKEPNQP